MNIAIDFDDCYTKDHRMWREFISTAHYRGHKVYIVTARYKEEEPVQAVLPGSCELIYTERNAKRPFLRDKLGVTIDIWIDDRPEYVDNEYEDKEPWTKEQQAEYRYHHPEYEELARRWRWATAVDENGRPLAEVRAENEG